jgi:uncharacterized protein YjbK
MKQELEIEFKNILIQKEFNQLLNAFSLNTNDSTIQENHYFDTATFALKAKGSALRIREKNGQYVVTLKQPAEVGLLESHQIISKEQAQSIIAGEFFINEDISDLIKQMGVMPEELTYFGSLRTKRIEVIYKNGTLVLDHSFYLDMEDYELEYEVSDPTQGHEDFLELLTKFNIPLRNTNNKIQRFYLASQHRN